MIEIPGHKSGQMQYVIAFFFFLKRKDSAADLTVQTGQTIFDQSNKESIVRR